jgi:predicted DNA-binding transcriptional regulator AlpA
MDSLSTPATDLFFANSSWPLQQLTVGIWQHWSFKMAITILKITPEDRKLKRAGHTRPKAPTISLDQPGRLRVAHLLSVLGVSHSTLYSGMSNGRYPKPDGADGRMPYWNTETIRSFLQAKCLN